MGFRLTLTHMSRLAVLSLASLSFLAAAASAQTMPVKRSNPSETFSAGLTYAQSREISGAGASDASGVTLDARASVTSQLYLTAAFANLKMDGIDTFPTPSTFDPKSYAIGFGTRFAAGNGSVELSYAFRNVDLGSTGSWTTAFADKSDQHLLRLAYSLELGNGLAFGLGLTQVFNGGTGWDELTAPEVTLGYKFGNGLSATLSYSTEDTLLGLQDGAGTASLGVRFGF